MKTALRLIVAIAIFWTISLVFQRTSGSRLLLDVILPSSVLSRTSLDERKYIDGQLQIAHVPSYLSFVAPISIVILGLFSLRKADSEF